MTADSGRAFRSLHRSDVLTGEPKRGGSIAPARKPKDAAISARKWWKLKSQASSTCARGDHPVLTPSLAIHTNNEAVQGGARRPQERLQASRERDGTIQIADSGFVAIILVFHHDYYFTNLAYYLVYDGADA
jgi:hypothetical protein